MGKIKILLLAANPDKITRHVQPWIGKPRKFKKSWIARRSAESIESDPIDSLIPGLLAVNAKPLCPMNKVNVTLLNQKYFYG